MNQESQIQPASPSAYGLSLYQNRVSETEDQDKRHQQKSHRSSKIASSSGLQAQNKNEMQSHMNIGQTSASKEHHRVEQQTPQSARHSSFTGMALSGYISSSGGYI